MTLPFPQSNVETLNLIYKVFHTQSRLEDYCSLAPQEADSDGD